MTKFWHLAGATLALAMTAACTGTPPIEAAQPQQPAAGPRPEAEARLACSTAVASITFDFAGAAPSRCTVLGKRKFALLIAPEHAPPINPSPWYAFRYRSQGEQGITVRLDYLGAKHRYRPKLTTGGKTSGIAAQVSKDGSSAQFRLPAGTGVVSGQEIFGEERYNRLLDRMAHLPQGKLLVLGLSLDGRPVRAARIGREDAPRLVVLLGRQHPPEVTGALAMEAFLESLASQIEAGDAALDDYQFLIVPLMNPDGVYHGHWRANRGAQDLNRDWGPFTQPETQAVHAWLKRLPATVYPVAMIDFHSTSRNLFYVQGEDETNEAQEAFLTTWLGDGRQIPGYAFAIERRNANPGSGTSKNWFHHSYGIPAFTYEVGDGTDPKAITRSAHILEHRFVMALGRLRDNTASRYPKPN